MKRLLLLSTFTYLLFTCSLAQTNTIQLPATGQTTSYYPGDDGELQMGVPIPSNRFSDNGNGSVTDAFTGLMWVKDANLIATRDPSFDQDRTPGDGDINWTTALNYLQLLNDENYLGHNDWRMPNCLELRSLVNLGIDSVALPPDHPFINLKEGYWGSTSSDRLRGNAISVYLSKYVVHSNTTYPSGHFESLGKNLGPTISYFVLYLLPVRSGGTNGDIEIPQSGQNLNYYNGDDGDLKQGTAWPSPRLVDNKDGSVTDRLTGLMWTANSDLMYSRNPEFDTCDGNNGSVYWETALGYIHKLNTENYLGYSDWRLPNRYELTSLIDHSRHGTCLPENHPFFTPWLYEAAGWYPYWSSTTLDANPEKAWVFHFGLSNLYYHDNNIERFVWPVRTDNSNLPSGSIYGFIDGEDIPKKGVEITIEGPVTARTDTDVDGYYEFAHLPDGNYNVTPYYEYFAFKPLSKTVTLSGSAVSCDFNANYTRAYGWVDISSNLFPLENAAGTGLSNLYFINDDEGWITSLQDIYHTTDGGETFEIQQTQLGGGTSAIHMLDANNGYCGGDGGWIYKTTNGGQNWDLLASMGNVRDISFPPNTSPSNPIGYTCGDPGLVWEITSTLTNLNSPSNSNFGGISTPSVNNVWVCGGGRIYYYNGTDFTSQSGLSGTFNDIHFVNDQLGWVVQNGGKIGGTQTGGIDYWQTLLPYATTDNRSYYGVHSPNEKDVWVVGVPGIIMHSPNGNDFYTNSPWDWENNTIWNQQATGLTNEFLVRVFFTSSTNGYCTGNNGTLLKYTLLEGAPEGADILDIQLPGQVGEAVINKEQRTVSTKVVKTIDITKIVPEIFPSVGATVDPPSGTRQDFTIPVVYKVTASDASTKNWTVAIIGVDGIGDDLIAEDAEKIRIYPNPTKNQLNIQGSHLLTDDALLTIFDLNGRKLIDKQIQAGSKTFEVDVNSLESGIYFCRISTNNYSLTKKLIIQK